MLSGLPAGPAMRSGWTPPSPMVPPTPAQTAARDAAYATFVDHAWNCARCWANESCADCDRLHRAIAKALR